MPRDSGSRSAHPCSPCRRRTLAVTGSGYNRLNGDNRYKGYIDLTGEASCVQGLESHCRQPRQALRRETCCRRLSVACQAKDDGFHCPVDTTCLPLDTVPRPQLSQATRFSQQPSLTAPTYISPVPTQRTPDFQPTINSRAATVSNVNPQPSNPIRGSEDSARAIPWKSVHTAKQR